MRRSRRGFITATGASLTAAVTGCLGLDSSDDHVSTEGDDDSPFDVEPETLLLGQETLADETDAEWNEEDLDDGFGAEVIQNESVLRDVDAGSLFGPDFSENIDFVPRACASTVRLYDTTETARQAFDGSPFQSGFGYESQQIAIESIGGAANDNGDGHVIFRDSNAIGALVYANQEDSTDERAETALNIAAAMHRSWR